MTKPRSKLPLRLGAFAALVALVALMAVILAGAEELPYSQGLTFKSNGDGTCSVSGIGTCIDAHVMIPPVSPAGDQVTAVEMYAFKDCSELTSVTIPEGVKSISHGAFYDCTELETVILPNSVTSISSDVFYNCGSLTAIAIPNSVTAIGEGLFRNCGSLASVNIPAGVTSIGRWAFSGCRSLTSVEIPAGVTTLNKNVFEGCVMLIQKENGVSYVDGWVIGCDPSVKQVNLRADTVGFCDYAFSECVSLASISIPVGVTNIPQHAFENCGNLKGITLPDTVRSIGFSAFSGCAGLTSVTIPDGLTVLDRYAFQNCVSLQNIRIPGGVKTIGWYAFSGCTSLANVSFSDGLTTIQEGAFRECGSLTEIDLPDTLTHVGSMAFFKCNRLTSIRIPDSMTRIGDSAFSGCGGVTSVYIPDSVTEIGSAAFGNCSNLRSIVIPKNVTKIGRSAFVGCSRLTSVVLPDGLLDIGEYAFSKCSSLTNITIPASVERVGESAFQGCTKLIRKVGGVSYVDRWAVDCDTTVTHAVLPENTAGIADSAFEYCRKLESVTIPASVTSVGSAAFAYCSSLTEVTVPTGTTYIGNETFKDCSSLKRVVLPEGIISIRDDAFLHCTSLTSIDLPDSVRDLYNSAFGGCTALKSVKLPEGITLLNGAAFSGCVNLTDLRIPASVTEIYNTSSMDFGILSQNEKGIHYVDNWVVGKDEGITTAIIRPGTVGIGDSAFEGDCKGMVNVVFPSSLKYIGEWAFETYVGWSVSNIYYLGTREEVAEITVGLFQRALWNATSHILGDCFDLTAASLTLGDSLTMNYYAKADPACGTPAMRFTYRGKTEYVTGVPTETEGEYVFSLKGIAPQCMGETIKAELILILEDGTVLVVDAKESYSVRRYCDDALAANPDNKALATLLADLLAYGDAAQNYTDFNADTPVSEGFEVAPSEWEDVTDTDFTLSDKTREDLRFASAGVRFGHVNRLYFKIKAADLTGVTLTVNGKTYTAEELTLVEDTADTYILYTDPVYATEFDKVFTAELSVDGRTVQTLTYSVRSYVYAKQNSENTEMAALVRALYTYGRSAVAYKNEQ